MHQSDIHPRSSESLGSCGAPGRAPVDSGGLGHLPIRREEIVKCRSRGRFDGARYRRSDSARECGASDVHRERFHHTPRWNGRGRSGGGLLSWFGLRRAALRQSSCSPRRSHAGSGRNHSGAESAVQHRGGANERIDLRQRIRRERNAGILGGDRPRHTLRRFYPSYGRFAGGSDLQPGQQACLCGQLQLELLKRLRCHESTRAHRPA